jgi:hypothetical protein
MMSDALDAVAAEAARGSRPVLTTTMHGRRWRFGRLDVRPSRLRRLADLARKLAAADPGTVTDADAIELSAHAEDLLRSALHTDDQVAFDDAPFTGSEISALAQDYFDALGATLGESAASPASSSTTAKRSRPTSRRRRR